MNRVHIPWRAVRRTALGVLAALIVLAIVATSLVIWTVRRAFPQHGGRITLPGLTAPVTVYRDKFGIPQVYADSADDLFRAQGYLHAQDRFWEMDFRRHVTAGRLAELFGPDQVPTDAYLRTLGWRRVAEREVSLISPEAKRYLSAYADGVNAYLKGRNTARISLEYSILGLQTTGYEPEPWDPVDSLSWLKAMAWDLRGNWSAEIGRAVLLGSGLSRDRVEQLYPPYPFERNRPIVTTGTVNCTTKDGQGRCSDGSFDATAAGGGTPSTPINYRAALESVARGANALPALLGTGAGIGSNSWVVNGSLTASGKPLLANDPHLSPSMPGIWYQMGLHCSCEYNVEGFTFSGVPGVVIGHNARIAWGFTNLDPDVTDLYLEQLQGDTAFDGTLWQPLTVRQETIRVAGGDDVTIRIRSTKHGPLLSDRSDELLGIAGRPGVDASGSPLPTVEPKPTPSLDAAQPSTPDAARASPYGVALRWTALDPGRTMDAVFTLNKATDWTGFRAAAAQFEVPAQNLVYADVDGNIGYQSPGKVPIRTKGDGKWPAPGWDPGYDWQGFIPFAQLPSVYNPSEGFIVTANQAVIGSQYPNHLTDDWSYGYRSQRIVDMLKERTGNGHKLSVEDFRQMQFDNRNGFAPTLVPALLAAPAAGKTATARDLLRDWDFQQPADTPARTSAAAAFYNVTWRHLLARTFDELPEGSEADGNDRWWEVVRSLQADPSSPWWDDVSTPARESMNDILTGAMDDAVKELGGKPADWRWGKLHKLTLRNATFGESGIGPIEWLFNSGPAGVSGGDAIVNATGWTPHDGYDVDALPSMRMIVDLSHLDGSRWIQLTGNSGHAFHGNYTDQFELWRKGENIPMRWDRSAIEDAASHTLTLRP